MSTRCQIAFVEFQGADIDSPQALIYRHSDGYPSGVLPDIMPFLGWWNERRGVNDIEYCSARLLQYLCNKYDGYRLEMSKEFKHLKDDIEEQKGFTGELGHGICKGYHSDIEYLYVIHPQGVDVFEVPHDLNWSDPKPIGSKVVKLGSIPLENWQQSQVYQNLVTVS